MMEPASSKKDIELLLISSDLNEFHNSGPSSTKVTISDAKPKYSKLGIYFTVLSVMGTVAGASVWKWNPGLPTVELLTARATVGCLSSYFLMKYFDPQASLRQIFSPQNLNVGLCGSLSLLTYALSLLSLSISEATTIYATVGIFNGIFGLIFLKDSYPISERLLGGICFLGVVLIVKPPFLFGEEDLSDSAANTPVIPRYVGGLLCLGSAATWSLMQIVLRGVRNKCTGFAAIFQNNLIMGALCLAYLIFRGNVQPIGFEGLVTSALLAACSSFLTWAIIKALQYEKPSVVGIVGYSEIIFAIMADILIFHTLPSFLTLIGMGMIIGSCLFLMKRAS